MGASWAGACHLRPLASTLAPPRLPTLLCLLCSRLRYLELTVAEGTIGGTMYFRCRMVVHRA